LKSVATIFVEATPLFPDLMGINDIPTMKLKYRFAILAKAFVNSYGTPLTKVNGNEEECVLFIP
jgi:hypothetical protein